MTKSEKLKLALKLLEEIEIIPEGETEAVLDWLTYYNKDYCIVLASEALLPPQTLALLAHKVDYDE